ncbi:hypothetical protein J6590_018348 [Homalodisca vitripennis]|nr:hypothetical protein J6590_018348 [Homalodisca vitripennis]
MTERSRLCGSIGHRCRYRAVNSEKRITALRRKVKPSITREECQEAGGSCRNVSGYRRWPGEWLSSERHRLGICGSFGSILTVRRSNGSYWITSPVYVYLQVDFHRQCNRARKCDAIGLDILSPTASSAEPLTYAQYCHCHLYCVCGHVSAECTAWSLPPPAKRKLPFLSHITTQVSLRPGDTPARVRFGLRLVHSTIRWFPSHLNQLNLSIQNFWKCSLTILDFVFGPAIIPKSIGREFWDTL